MIVTVLNALALAAAAPAGPAGHHLVFADEFTGATLDRSKGIVEGDGFWVDDEQQISIDSPDVIAVAKTADGAAR